ncbi:hypothetical protein Dvina_49105 [Dactylosporangium vinaceum]|uniref:Glycosyl transferase n=1 Tax=Dactylosporangium vinaceum TaxID=53362 RepID=A0ABV5LYD9_9ACTN|nr:hypothetical protein [Dactylosporangium vinaceum]UAB95851.1 hypothetical protein Dvina_49105 [Dactylosporangium vinaceum]
MRWGRPWISDVAACAFMVLVAAFVTRGLLADPAGRALSLNPGDQALDEWFLAYATRAYRGDFAFVTGALNAPEGINVLGNASLIGLGLLFAPLTLAFGAPVTFAVATGFNLAANGAGWYLLLSRTARLHRLAAGVGGVFCGFAPGMVSQSNGHLHMTAAWLVPAIVWCVVTLAQGTRTVQRGLLLGGLVVAQFFLGEEVLLLTAVALALFCLAFVATCRPIPRHVLPSLGLGLVIAGGVALALLAYPIWVQFRGPQSAPGAVFRPEFYSADLKSFAALSPLSLAGGNGATRLASGPSEYTAFFGAPALIAVLGATLWMWRRPAVVACTVVSIVLWALALGPHIVVGHERTEQWAPYSLIAGTPIVEWALPTRFALATVPLLGFVLASVVHAAITQTETLKVLVPVAVIAALVPLAPRPLPTADRAPVPRFFTEGYWRGYAPRDGTIVPVPLPDWRDPQPMRWAAATNVAFATPQGWFIGPYGTDGTSAVGVFPRPTSQLLHRALANANPPALTDQDRIDLRRDIAFWHASCFVLADGQAEAGALHSTLDALLGPGEHVADVWVWRARA